MRRRRRTIRQITLPSAAVAVSLLAGCEILDADAGKRREIKCEIHCEDCGKVHHRCDFARDDVDTTRQAKPR